MDTDGLIHAGSGLDQVTWMDVRVGDWVATPRHGKPVEINALWYNALCTMDMLQAKFGDNDDSYRQLASLVKASFNKRFWNENTGCLYDVVDEDDDTIRPNQIYAVSLPFTMLDREREKAIVDTVMDKLYVAADCVRSILTTRITIDLHRLSLKARPCLSSGNSLGLSARWFYQCLCKGKRPYEGDRFMR